MREKLMYFGNKKKSLLMPTTVTKTVELGA